MNFKINTETLLRPLQMVSSVVERRQSLPILGNVLFGSDGDDLVLTATDMEVELVARIPGVEKDEGDMTLPARKLVDICRALPADSSLSLLASGEKAVLQSGRSRFKLTTLPARDFPNMEPVGPMRALSLEKEDVKKILSRTQFAMAIQDVRYYLNGLLLENSSAGIRTVATDGHRLALCDSAASGDLPDELQQVIIPRKGVIELSRLLGGEGNERVQVAVGTQSIQVRIGDIQVTSKLIDGKFPDYERVVPEEERCDKRILADREQLRQSLVRASILSNEKYRAVRLGLEENLLRIQAHNPDQEEAEEEVEVEYSGDGLEIGFNVTYLIDALSAIKSDTVILLLSDENSSCLIKSPEDGACRYVVMPMRL